MKAKLKKSEFEEIYRLLGSVSPLDYDCGTLCGAACCTKGDDPEMGIYLLPGEEKLFERDEDWFVWSTERAEDYDFPDSWKGAVHFIRCKTPPVCPREKRPIQCRSFPLLPHISEDGELSLVYNDFETPYSCPLIEEELPLNDDFYEATLEAWRRLISNPLIYDLVRMDSKNREDSVKELAELLGEDIG